MTLIAVLGVIAVGLVSTVVSVAAAAARTTVLIMGGSGDPLSTDQDGLPFIRDYTAKAVANFVTPSAARPETGIPGGPYNAVAVITPAEFNSGHPSDHTLTFDKSVAAGLEKLDTCIESGDACDINEDLGSDRPAPGDDLVVFGYSQSSAIATLEKIRLAEKYPFGEGPDVSFILTANGNRPNGGFLARGPQGFTIPLGLPYGGATFNGSTPTNTQYSTIDIAYQYDGWADQPINPANLLAVANASAGQRLLHPHYADHSLDEPGIIDQGQYGDTRYLMIPADTLPLLYELSQTPVVGSFLADVLDAPLRVLVEAGYDRTSSPGEPKPWTLIPAKDPLKTAADFLVAIPTGWDNAIEDVNGTRPFGTQRPGPFGVGGPDVDYLDPSELDPSDLDSSGDEDSATPATSVSRETDSRAEAVTDQIEAATETATEKVATKVATTLAGAVSTVESEPQTAETDEAATSETDSETSSDTAHPAPQKAPEKAPQKISLKAPQKTSQKTQQADTTVTTGSEDKAVTKTAGATPDPEQAASDGGTSAGRHSSGVTAKPSEKESTPKHRAAESDAGTQKTPRNTGTKAKHAASDGSDRQDRQAKPGGAHRAADKNSAGSDKSAASAAKS
ncbi:PE-PPE domain-containing protein [Mycolicibacterium goodii]